jgi:cell division septum initiation protein DivIVA
MGEDPDELREAIEETRRRMDETVVALGQKVDVKSQARAKVAEVRERVTSLGWRRWVPYAAGAAAVTGGAVAAVVMLKVRSARPPERLAVPARRLPKPAQEVVLPVARRADRLLAQTTHELGEKRQRATQAMAREIARGLAEEQEKHNPLWRRILRDASTAAATTGATLLVRRALSSPVQAPLRKADKLPGESPKAVPMERVLSG